ncbi:hypothetical protein AVL62_08260 [Serinicoccus chungangensis]|uniref:DUF2975 domain-containing protein n=1 Tax=Serinicoccus chungangensis TaxID=767452 RepID=A0A0W8I2E3_9MICO|nr:DUF2975 domain-containing protein [Serinicoccus chungangensis]KUG51921.1 hypothetical protein AVL62_08260 [Serinicoccus chungangensis]
MNVVVGAAVALCALQVFLVVSGIPVIPSDDAWVPPSALPQVLQLDLPVDALRTEVTVLPLWIRLLGVSSTVLMAAMLVIALRAVHHVARRSAQGRPFADDVVRRLRRVAVWLLALVGLRLLVDVATGAAVERRFADHLDATEAGGALGIDLPSLSVPMIVAAAVAAVLAHAFATGRDLVDATDGLV